MNDDNFSLDDVIKEHDERNGCSCKEGELTVAQAEDDNYSYDFSILLPELVTILLKDLRKAEKEHIKTQREHQHAKATLWTDGTTIETIQEQLGISKQPTQKQIESYIRLETKEYEILRYEAESEYNHLNRIYERL